MEQAIQPPDQQLLNSTSSETSQNSAHARKSRISLFSEYILLYAPFSSNLNVEERQKTINLNIVSGFGRIESNKIAEVEYSILQSKKFQNMDQSADQKEQGLKDLEKLQEWDDKREIHEAKYKGILRDIDGIFSQSGKQNTGFAQIADKISFGMGTVQEQSRKSISKSFKKQIDIQSSKLVQGLPYILLLFHHYPYCINGNCAFHVEVDYKTDGFLDSISVL